MNRYAKHRLQRALRAMELAKADMAALRASARASASASAGAGAGAGAGTGGSAAIGLLLLIGPSVAAAERQIDALEKLLRSLSF